jgi:hypothetical protein
VANNNKTSSLAAALKDQIALISLLVLFAGFVSTDTYYSAFGLRFQLLDLPINHLIYRGLSALVNSSLLAPAYILAIAWLAFGAQLVQRYLKATNEQAQAISYTVIAVAVIAAYFGGIVAGRNAANEDILEATSRLPVIQSITNSKGEPLQFEENRLLLNQKDRVVVFRPVKTLTELPFVHILRGDDVGEIVVTR